MNFLTTNFDSQMDSKFNNFFNFQSLPLEILIKILIFLDYPELLSLSKTCKFFHTICNDSYITKSQFLYKKDLIGLSLRLRPNFKYLQKKNYLPITNFAKFNLNQYKINQDLEKHIKIDRLNKDFKKRPNLKELVEKNIIKFNKDCNNINNKKQMFKKMEIDEMLKVLVSSYKFNNKGNMIKVKQRSLSDSNIEIFSDSGTSASSVLSQRGTNSDGSGITTDKGSSNSTSYSFSTSNSGPSTITSHITGSAVTSNDTELKVCQNYVKRASYQFPKCANKPLLATKEPSTTTTTTTTTITTTTANSTKPTKVQDKKKYFENLTTNPLHPVDKNRKPSKTILNVKIINNDKISYEKIC